MSYTPRTGQQQFNEELALMHKTMTDPEEQKKEKIRQDEEEVVELVESDAGL